MEEKFDEFLAERKYLLNVSPKTLVYYRCAFTAWRKHRCDGKPATWIQNMMAAGIKPVSINTYICAMNAYWKWSGEGKHLAYIKEEQKVLATFSPEQVKRLLGFKPRGRNQTRTHVGSCVMLDSGLRLSEVLELRTADIDFDNLLIKVRGKGNKQRLVPMSYELRKILYRYSLKRKESLLFGTR